ncbi:hypothetical protein [Nocardia sp. NPDC057227]
MATIHHSVSRNAKQIRTGLAETLGIRVHERGMTPRTWREPARMEAADRG